MFRWNGADGKQIGEDSEDCERKGDHDDDDDDDTLDSVSSFRVVTQEVEFGPKYTRDDSNVLL